MFQRGHGQSLFRRNGSKHEAELATINSGKEVAARARALMELEWELAVREVRDKAQTAAVGASVAAGAGLFAVLAIGFAFAALAAGLATTLPVWLSILIVTVILAGLAAVAGLVAKRLLERAVPPLPARAILEAKRTRDAVAGL